MKRLIAAFAAICVFCSGCQTLPRPTQSGDVSAEPHTQEPVLPTATVVSGGGDNQETMSPATPAPTESAPPTEMPDVFSSSGISLEIQEIMLGKTIHETSLVQFQDLCYLTITYWGYDDQKHVGNMIVNYQIADDTLEIFKVLLEHKFPIEKMVLPAFYDGVDELSMRDNNTSAFNDRPIDGSGALSWHQMGLAIDINPLYNPYIHFASGKLEPSTGGEYLDRTLALPGMIVDGDICVSTFKQYGFSWGGDWNTVKDYQHFEMPIY